MPWTDKDAERHDRDASTPKKKRQWAKVANSVKKKTGDDSRAIRAANSVVGKKKDESMKATLYRDPDYGALAVIDKSPVLEVHNHNFLDREPVYRVLAAQATQLSETEWRPRVHPAILTANLERAMRTGGYEDDPLAERAILRVSEEEARQPDLPAGGVARVSEAVERAISQQLDTALGQVKLPGKVVSGVMEAFPRPHTRDSMGRNLPFFRARAEVQLGPRQELGAGTCAAWRKALEGLGENLVRASVRVENGIATFEAAVRPNKAVLETFESLALPAFGQAPISGYREVHIQLQEPLPKGELERIRERAEACTGAIHLEASDPRVLVAHVPSMVEGQHLGDPAFRERTNWLVQEFHAQGGELGWVGLMRNKHGAVVESEEAQKAANLTEMVAPQSCPTCGK